MLCWGADVLYRCTDVLCWVADVQRARWGANVLCWGETCFPSRGETGGGRPHRELGLAAASRSLAGGGNRPRFVSFSTNTPHDGIRGAEGPPSPCRREGAPPSTA